MTAQPSRWWDPTYHSDRRPFLIARNRMRDALRAWFGGEDFIEVETACLQVSPGNELHLRAFRTRITEPDGTAGPWYYHLFAAEQPDLNWQHPAVLAELERVVRTWLDRGVDGFRVDVSDALVKDPAFPDTPDGSPVIPKDEASGVHEVYRALRRVLDEYPGDRAAVVETGAPDEVVALFVRPDEMHLAFGFRFLHAGWDAGAVRAAIGDTLASAARVGAPATWVTDNHDSPRSVTRYGRDQTLAGAYVPTQVPLLLEAEDVSVPLVDSAEVLAAVCVKTCR